MASDLTKRVDELHKKHRYRAHWPFPVAGQRAARYSPARPPARSALDDAPAESDEDQTPARPS